MENQRERLSENTVSDCNKFELPNGRPQEDNRIRKITIEELNRGFIVNVGCSTFAFSTKDELITILTEYINEPNLTEKKWHAGDLF